MRRVVRGGSLRLKTESDPQIAQIFAEPRKSEIRKFHLRKSAQSADASYVELHACSAFNFLRGASMPEQMVERAIELGMPALALHDRDGVYGAPRFFASAREQGLRP